MSDRPLTPKQRKFLTEYLGGAAGNGAEAARRAGYKGTPAVLAQMATENLRKPHIAQAIREHREKTVSDGILTAQECAVLLSGMATGALGEDQPEGGQAPAKHATRIKAIEVLAKLRGYDKPAVETDATASPTLAPDMERALIRLAQLTPEQWAAWQAGVTS